MIILLSFGAIFTTRKFLLVPTAKTAIVGLVHCKPVGFIQNRQRLTVDLCLLYIEVWWVIVTPLLRKSSILAPHNLPLLLRVGLDLLEIFMRIIKDRPGSFFYHQQVIVLKFSLSPVPLYRKDHSKSHHQCNAMHPMRATNKQTIKRNTYHMTECSPIFSEEN